MVWLAFIDFPLSSIKATRIKSGFQIRVKFTYSNNKLISKTVELVIETLARNLVDVCLSYFFLSSWKEKSFLSSKNVVHISKEEHDTFDF